MLESRVLTVSDRRSARYSKQRRGESVAPSEPEGWSERVRVQSQNLGRAIEMLEQALSMLSEPRAHALARAQCLRGAGLITLIAASELLVMAGWHEADQAVKGGTRDA
ncbi:MAG: hypothetical protein ACOY0T_38745 [Myxococcota bacterium]